MPTLEEGIETLERYRDSLVKGQPRNEVASKCVRILKELLEESENATHR